MPRVSIITPFYNSTEEQFIRSSSSIQNQTSKNFEWILVDDGSDDTDYIYDVRLDKNYGPSVARNAGFQISSGEIITYLDMGDELYPGRVENIIKLYDQYPSLELVFCAYDVYQPHGIGTKKFRFDHMDYIGKYANFPTAFEYIQLLQTQNITIPLGVSHKKKNFVRVGGFQRGIVCGEDGVTWRRMVDLTPLTNIMFSDTVAGCYYVTEYGQSRTQRRFEMGGFAIQGDYKDNGKYLDENWYENFDSEGLYDG